MLTKLNKDNILPEDHDLAINVRNYIRSGDRVIGTPGEGLRQTLVELEHKRDAQKNVSILDWSMKDPELETQIALTKAGLEGEIKLCEYLQTLLKNDDKLQGIVAFASLSSEPEKFEQLGYTPDTDTLLVYGRNLLVIDAKNLKLKPNQEVILVGNVLMDPDKGKELLTVHASTPIWENIMSKRGLPIDSIDGYVCIVNDTPIDICRDDEWYASTTKPIHISELRVILEEWVESHSDCDTMYLDTLVEVAKTQIKEEKNISFDVNAIKRMYGI
jgi:hypothetical protein